MKGLLKVEVVEVAAIAIAYAAEDVGDDDSVAVDDIEDTDGVVVEKVLAVEVEVLSWEEGQEGVLIVDAAQTDAEDVSEDEQLRTMMGRTGYGARVWTMKLAAAQAEQSLQIGNLTRLMQEADMKRICPRRVYCARHNRAVKN